MSEKICCSEMLSSVLQTVCNCRKSIIRENSSPLYSMSLYYDQSFITCHAKVTSVKFAYLFLLSFKSRLSLIVRVNVVLNRTVVVDSDGRFDNLCGSHLQSQSELCQRQLMVLYSGY